MRPSAFLLRAAATAGFAGGAVLAVACQVPGLELEGMRCPCLDGFTCVDDVCRPLGAGAGGGAGSASSGSAGGVSMSPSSDGCTGPLQLQGEVAPGAFVTVGVEGCWSVTFTEESRWQPTLWYDLASDPEKSANLASDDAGHGTTGGDLLFAPAYLSAGPWLSPEDAPTGDVTATLEDGTPAYITLATHVRWEDAPNANLPGIESTTRYTVWASGRIAAHTELVNTGGATHTVPDLYYSEVAVGGALSEWTGDSLPEPQAFDAHAASLRRTVGPAPRPNLLVIDRSGDDSSLIGVPEQEPQVGWGWRILGLDLEPGGPAHVWDAEIQLAPGGQDVPALIARADDALTPGAPFDGTDGFDAAAAVYRLTAGASSIEFAPAGSFARHRPAFVIEGWSHAAWRISRAGELLATSATPSSPRAAARHDAGAARLSFVYLDVIAAAGTDTPFVLEAQ